MTLAHSTELVACAQYCTPWPCNVDQIAQMCSLGSAEDRLYPFGAISGEAKIMFKCMSEFALAMLVCAPALADETEYHRPGYYQY